MRNALAVIAALAVGTVLMAARPVSELQLFNQLNGQPTRWRLFDGGASGIFAAGVSNCFPFDGGVMTGSNDPYVPNVLMLVPQQPVNVCVRPQLNPSGAALPWDGGCNGNYGDINFGVQLQPFAPNYIVPHAKATHVCSASDAGAHQVPVWGMQ